MATKPFPILIITATDIGGALAASGLVKRLFDEIPYARFAIVTDVALAPLFAEVPNLDRVITAPRSIGLLERYGLVRRLNTRRWGLIVDARDCGLSGYLRRERRAVLQPKPGAPLHPVVALAEALGLEADPPPPFLYTSPEIDAAADEALGEGGPILAIAPGAAWSGRAWPVERFAQLAGQLLGADGPMPDGRLLVVGDPNDGDVIEASRFAIARQRLVSPALGLGVLGDYALLKRVRLFIGNDGPWMHLAAAAGAPTLGLFGPSDERTAAPWGRKARSVRGPRPFEAFQAIDPGLNQAIGHMMDLPVQTVLDAAQDLFTATEPRHG